MSTVTEDASLGTLSVSLTASMVRTHAILLGQADAARIFGEASADSDSKRCTIRVRDGEGGELYCCDVAVYDYRQKWSYRLSWRIGGLKWWFRKHDVVEGDRINIKCAPDGSEYTLRLVRGALEDEQRQPPRCDHQRTQHADCVPSGGATSGSGPLGGGGSRDSVPALGIHCTDADGEKAECAGCTNAHALHQAPRRGPQESSLGAASTSAYNVRFGKVISSNELRQASITPTRAMCTGDGVFADIAAGGGGYFTLRFQAGAREVRLSCTTRSGAKQHHLCGMSKVLPLLGAQADDVLTFTPLAGFDRVFWVTLWRPDASAAGADHPLLRPVTTLPPPSSLPPAPTPPAPAQPATTARPSAGAAVGDGGGSTDGGGSDDDDVPLASLARRMVAEWRSHVGGVAAGLSRVPVVGEAAAAAGQAQQRVKREAGEAGAPGVVGPLPSHAQPYSGSACTPPAVPAAAANHGSSWDFADSVAAPAQGKGALEAANGAAAEAKATATGQPRPKADVRVKEEAGDKAAVGPQSNSPFPLSPACPVSTATPRLPKAGRGVLCSSWRPVAAKCTTGQKRVAASAMSVHPSVRDALPASAVTCAEGAASCLMRRGHDAGSCRLGGAATPQGCVHAAAGSVVGTAAQQTECAVTPAAVAEAGQQHAPVQQSVKEEAREEGAVGVCGVAWGPISLGAAGLCDVPQQDWTEDVRLQADGNCSYKRGRVR